MNGDLSYRDIDLQARQIEACVQRLQRVLAEDSLQPQLQVAALLTASAMVLKDNFPHQAGISWSPAFKALARQEADRIAQYGPDAIATCLGRLSLLIAKEASIAEAIEGNVVEINGARLLTE